MPVAPAVPIIVGTPSTLDELLGRIASPDFVLLRGDRYREFLKTQEKAPVNAPEPIVESVAIRGRIDRLSADLDVEFRVASTSAAPRWVPLRLDGLVLTSAREGTKVVPLRAGPTGGWEAEVRGAGEHSLRLAFATRVVAQGEERRLEFSLPTAGTNTLSLTLAGDPVEASVGPGESILIEKAAGQNSVRIEAALRPRARLEMRWRVPTEQSGVLPPLLTALGDVAVDVTADAIRTRSRWSVTSTRGAAPSLIFAYNDEDEDLVEVDLDGRALPQQGRDGGSPTVTIPLADPLRPGGPTRVVTLVTRRRIGAASSAKVPVRGAVPGDAAIVGGAVAVTRSGPIWVEGDAVRGLQRIDPANDLPSDLRSRPGTVLAYRIVDRPFELALRIEPFLPRVEARASTTVSLIPGTASTETRLAFRTTPGRVFDLHFPLPPGVEIDPIAADDVVESSNLSASGGEGTVRVLAVGLTPKARGSGAFSLTLKTRQTGTPEGGKFGNALIWPSEASSLGGRVAVLAAPGVEAKLVEGGPFRPLSAISADDWPWPIPRPADLDRPQLWASYEGRQDFLPLEIQVRPTSYRSETDLVAEVGRDGINYRQSVRLDVLGGRVDTLELLVPPGVERGWTVEGAEVSGHHPVASDPDGSSRFRVVLAPRALARVAFELRYKIPFERPLTEGAARPGRFAPIRTIPDAPGPVRLSYGTSPGVSLTIDARGWQERLAGMPSTKTSPSLTALERSDPSAPMPAFEARAEPLLALPGLVVSRTFLRTVRGPDELRTSAVFRFETADPSVVVALPSGSRWVRARLDGVELREVEVEEAPDRYRCRLSPTPSAGPRSLAIDYARTGSRPSPWEPAALAGAVSESVYWQVVVGGDQAVLGTPSGWSDENRWRWMKYVWMKTPLRTDAELLEWAAGVAPASAYGPDPTSRPTSQHAYLFRKADGLGPLPVMVVSRSALVVVCSGAVALVGIGLVLLRRSARPYVVLAVALVAMIGAACDPDLALQVIPSGVVGLILTAIAAALQWIVTRRSAGARGRFAAASTSTAPSTSAIPSPPVSALSDVGSDDSTAIRARPSPSATGDRFAISPAVSAEPSPSISELGIRP